MAPDRGRGRSLGRRLLFALLVGAGTIGAVVVGVLAWAHRLSSGTDWPSGSIEVDGLSAPVEILVDSLGVPHLWAGSEEDLFFAQGFLHAADRLWQMELFRRTTSGRLAEIFGSEALGADRFLRTLGMDRAAERAEAALEPRERALLEAYAAGVTAAIEGWEGPQPPELFVLGIDPEPWTVAQTIAMEKVMAWDLAEWERTIDLTRAYSLLGPTGYEEVRPQDRSWGATILEGVSREGTLEDGMRAAPAALGPSPSPARPTAAIEDRPGGAAALPRIAPDLLVELIEGATPPPLAAGLLDAASAVRASNAWVVGASRSTTGAPLLANDMHLALRQPPLWYLIGLHAPGIDAVGMSLPGAPGVVVGRSGGVAWGFTNAYLDDTDLFLVEPDSADPRRYRTPEGPVPFETRTELIPVRGQEAPDTLIVRETRWGPIMTPVEPRTGGTLLALRWIAHEPSGTLPALLGMNRASSADAFIEALTDFTNPHQNVVFADTAGRFGYWMAGRIPIRGDTIVPPPILPVAGAQGTHEWVGRFPFEEHPHLLDPERGYIVTANNRQSRDSSALRITDHTWAAPYRALRIEELILARPLHDLASFAAIQMDVESLFARRYLDAARAAFARVEAGGADDADATDLAGRAARAREVLAAWQGEHALNSRGPGLFHSWFRSLRAQLRERAYAGAPSSGTYPMEAVERALDEGGPTIDSLAAVAARRALAEWDNGIWGAQHRISFDHPLGGVPALARLFGFGGESVSATGAVHTPNVADFNGTFPPYDATHGPSQRAVVDLGDPDLGGHFILPGGQSGRPKGRHSWDQLPYWREGRLWYLPIRRGAVEARTVRRVELVGGGREARPRT